MIGGSETAILVGRNYDVKQSLPLTRTSFAKFHRFYKSKYNV